MTFDGSVRPGTLPAPRPYWSPHDAIEQARARPIAGPTDAMADTLEAALSDAVAARMVADVPVGAFLSGGIDSSLVVALMQRHSDRPVRTFTIGFADRAFDESAEAAAVAAHLGTDHTLLRVTDRTPSTWCRGCRSSGTSRSATVSEIPMYLVSRLARTEVTVALSGDGGDELFAGYNRHAWLERIWRTSSSLPAPVRRAAGAALGSLPPGMVDGVARGTAVLPARHAGPQPLDQGRQGGQGPVGRRGRGRLLRTGLVLGRRRVHGRSGPAPLRRWRPGRIGLAGARRASPSRCCGSTSSGTCPTTS